MQKQKRDSMGRFTKAKSIAKKICATIIILSVLWVSGRHTLENYLVTNFVYAQSNIEFKAPVIINDDRTIKEHVWDLLDEFDYSLDEKITLLAILQCESSMNPYAVNKNAGGSYDLGIAQWNTQYHPEIERACSFDVYCAVRAMAEYYKESGHYNAWVCS